MTQMPNIAVNDNMSIDKKVLLIKISVFLFIVGFYVVGFAFAYNTFYLKKRGKTAKTSQILLQAPLKTVSWKDIGRVSDPVVNIPVKTEKGYEKTDFLLDSGAVISSLPREMAKKMGLNLAFLKRVNFVGFGDKESFAYKGKMNVLLGKLEIELPVVFTSNYKTRSLLGRQGFFDEFVIIFDKKRGIVEIKK